MNRPLEIIIARYNEEVDWALSYSQQATIYNKGVLLPSFPQVILPNVGREAHTYLHHIVAKYHDLADWNVFTQADHADHMPKGSFHWLFEPSQNIKVGSLVSLKEWGEDGRIQHLPQWRAKLSDGSMRRADLSLLEYFRLYIGHDCAGALDYTPGAIFAVGAERIHMRPIEYYRRLLGTVDQHRDPEEAHYLERAWLYIFNGP